MTKRQAGFTIIEVLIATLVFTVVLLICLQGITQIGKVYYKGVSQSQAQEVVRSLADEISEQIQFGSTVPSANNIPMNANGGATNVFCIGDNIYQLTLNRQVASGVSALLRMPKATANCDTSASFATAQEVIPRGMRLSAFTISQDATNPALWLVRVKVVSGDNELLINTTDSDPNSYNNATCKTGISGSQYCASAEIQTSVLRRIR